MPGSTSPPHCCPRCRSPRITELRSARRALGVLGTLAGAVGGVLPTLAGAEVGATVGAVAGPPGAAVGVVCGAVLAGLSGGGTGCLLGTRLGQAIDDHLIDAHACLSCGHRFKRVHVPTRTPPARSP